MAEIPLRLLPHRVDVEPFTGAGARGDTYAAKVPSVRCMRDDRIQLVRTTTGEEVVSQTTLIMRLAQEPHFPAGSKVTLPTRTATVIGVARRDDGGLGAWQHLEVTLS